MYANNYSSYLCFIVSSFSGILFIVTIVKNFRLFKELSFIGRNSLIYYSFHGLILSTSGLLINVIFSVEVIKDISYYLGIINVFLCLFILHGVVILLNKYNILSTQEIRLFKNKSLIKEGR